MELKQIGKQSEKGEERFVWIKWLRPVVCQALLLLLMMSGYVNFFPPLSSWTCSKAVLCGVTSAGIKVVVNKKIFTVQPSRKERECGKEHSLETQMALDINNVLWNNFKNMIAKRRGLYDEAKCIYLVHLEEFAVKLSWRSMPNVISHVLSQEWWDQEVSIKWQAHSVLFCTVQNNLVLQYGM